MEQDKLNTELLLEIALSQNPEGNTEDILRKILPVYLKKLGCFAAAVFQKGAIVYIQPEALRNNTKWKATLKTLEAKINNKKNEVVEIIENNSYYYSYPLAGYGRLILGKKKALSRELKFELKKIIYQLGKNLQLASQQEEVGETRQKLESILNELEDVIWSVRLPDYKMIFVTPSVKSMYGIPVQKWLEDSSWWEKAIIKEDHAVISKIYHELETKGEFNEKYRIQTKDGKIKWVRNRAKVIFDNNQNPIRIDGIIMDRSRQYEAQEKLDNELLLQEVLIDIASTYINIDLKDVEKTIHNSLEKMGCFVNADRSYIFNYDFENKTTSNTYEWCNEGIIPEIDNLQNVPMEFFPQWIEAHQRGEAFYIPDVLALDNEEDEGLRAILEPQGIKSLITIPMNSNNELIGFVGFDSVRKHHIYTEQEQRLLHLFGQMIINIQKRKKGENRLRIQEEKYRNIISNMNLGLLEVDNNNTILFANQTFCEMSGYTINELKGQIVHSLFVPEEKHPVIQEKNESSDSGITDSYEIRFRDKKGKTKWWFSSGAPNFNDRGQQTGRIQIHLDITKQKNLERELAKAKSVAEDAAKSKEIFLANMSHEIRTPLNVIIGMIRELGKQNLGSDQRFYVAQSDSAAKHLLTILNHILDMAKIESGELKLENLDFSISAVASNAYSILHSQAEEKNIDFHLIVDENLWQAHIGDEGRIKQVLINILGNAIKFTESGSVIFRVDLVNDNTNEQRIKFTIKDTGIGMSEEFLDKLFNKFAQEQNTSNRKYEGTGLGMSIAREMIILMGSDIEIKSNKGNGTTVTFELVLPKGDISKLRFAARKIERNTFAGKHVLIVEDNEMNRFIAIQSLHFFGCSVDEAINGQEAIEKAKEKAYDLILMDIQMPTMDGLEATLLIRNELKIETPIIALTANAFRHDIERYLKSGMDNFVTKPFSEEELYFKILPFLKENDISDPITNDPLYNLNVLEKLSHGDQNFVKHMLELFVKSSGEAIIEFEDAMKQKDFRQVNNTAHRIKPSIDNMGITTLKEKIRELEKFPIDGNHIDRKNLVNKVRSTLLKVCEQIKNR